MELDNYLLLEVKPEEFAELKRQEAGLIDSVMNGFNDRWNQKVKGVKTTFRYNLQRNAIGIYIERDGKKQLIVERQGLSESEEAVVRMLYETLEQKLNRLRLPKEDWVDSV